MTDGTMRRLRTAPCTEGPHTSIGLLRQFETPCLASNDTHLTPNIDPKLVQIRDPRSRNPIRDKKTRPEIDQT